MLRSIIRGERRREASPNDRVKFATYRRDSEGGLDYAGNRHYDNVTGRFMEADPHHGRADAGNPHIWNRHRYGGMIRSDTVMRLGSRRKRWAMLLGHGLRIASKTQSCAKPGRRDHHLRGHERIQRFAAKAAFK
jgi:RHS repeat-associated protein